MPDAQQYCSSCGAANAIEVQLCFACQAPLNQSAEEPQEILLNERYRLLTRVGSGGFGGVYRAVDTVGTLGTVAVKEISLRGLSTQEVIGATDGFHRELRLLSALHHPSLPRIHDTFTDAEHWYLVMDFIEGETLETYLQHTPAGKLSLDETLEIGSQLCAALRYLHTRVPTIIFRDLKPSNVMRTSSGSIYLIDFGIARHFTPGKQKDTAPLGSPGYAAPEQYGRAQTTPQADIYSLGALLHHLLTGNDPTENPFRFTTLPLADSDSSESTQLNTLLQRMVAIEPDERPTDIAEVAATFQKLHDRLRRQKTVIDVDAPPAKKPHMARRRVLKVALAVGGGVVGAGGILALCGLSTRLMYHGPYGITALALPSPEVAKKRLIYQGHKGPITTLSWSPDGTLVASGSADKTVQVWRASDGALLYTYLGYDDPVTSLAWATAADEKNRITSGGMSDGTVQVWNALQDDTYLTFHGHGRALALSWQENSPWIVSGGTDREIIVWNGMTGEKCTSYTGHKGDVRALTWLPSLAISAPSLNVNGTVTSDGTGTSGAAVSSEAPIAVKNPIASGGADGTVQIWDGDTGKHLLTYSAHKGGVNTLAFVQGPENYFRGLVSASDDQTVQVWDLTSPSPYPNATYRRHLARVNALAALSPVYYYGPRVASASDDHSVQVWSSSNGEHLFTYAEHGAPVKALAASPVANDNRMVSGDENGLVHLWTIDHASYQ